MISNTSLSAFSAASIGPPASGIAPGRLAPTLVSTTNTVTASSGKLPPARPDITTTTTAPRPNLPRGSLLDLSI